MYQKQHKTTVEILQSAGGGAHRFRLRRSGHFLGVVSQGRQQGRAAGVARLRFRCLWFLEECGSLRIGYLLYPIGSMHGIFANIWGILMVNVTIYGIHGSYGYIDTTTSLFTFSQ